MRAHPAICSLFVLALATSGSAVAVARQAGTPAQPTPVLRYSIVGSSSCDTIPCYSRVMRSVAVQKLLLRLAGGPLDAQAATAQLEGAGDRIDDLLALRLIRREGERYVLNFALFTAEDLARIRQVSERWAASLAAAVLARRADIEDALRAYDASGVDRGEVAYFLLGCASLDWDGLVVTAEEGYRKATAERPDGNYVPAAQEIIQQSLQRVYWGSHNDRLDAIGVTSFGDHYALPRTMLPDLEWLDPRFPDSVPEPPRKVLDTYLAWSFRGGATKLARIMVMLRDGGRTAAQLADSLGADQEETKAALDALLALDYVSEQQGLFRARIPVLTSRDEAMARRILAVGRAVMKAWLAENFDAIKGDLGDLSFTRSGVPFEEGFTMIWHYLFGISNEKLVEAGLFADPYAPSRQYQGAIPAVYTLDL